MALPISASVDLSKLRSLLMILACFILFFSIIPVFETGLNRFNLILGAFFFFSSSICFWFSSSYYDFYYSDKYPEVTKAEEKNDQRKKFNRIKHGLKLSPL